jgi:hypothetical protein
MASCNPKARPEKNVPAHTEHSAHDPTFTVKMAKDPCDARAVVDDTGMSGVAALKWHYNR